MDSHQTLLSSVDKEGDDESAGYGPAKRFYNERGAVTTRNLQRTLFFALIVQLLFLIYGTFLFFHSLPPGKVYPGTEYISKWYTDE
jgi:hypothetical protein